MVRPMLLFLGLSACAPPAVQGESTCDAPGLSPLIGQPVSATDLVAGPDLRIVRPDTAVTMDFRPDRTNVAVDAGGIITAVTCG